MSGRPSQACQSGDSVPVDRSHEASAGKRLARSTRLASNTGKTFRTNRLRLLPVVREALIKIAAIKLNKGQCQKSNRRHHGQEIGPEIHRTPPIAVKLTSSSIRTLTRTFTPSRN
jgi:hypothetical protein